MSEGATLHCTLVWQHADKISVLDIKTRFGFCGVPITGKST